MNRIFIVLKLRFWKPEKSSIRFGLKPIFCCWEISSKLWVSLLNLVLNQRIKIHNYIKNVLKNKLKTQKQSKFHEETRNSFLGLKPIWNSKAEIPMSVIKSNQDIKFNLNIQERKAYTVLNRFCHVMCQSRPDTIPLYLVARCLPGALQGQTHFESASKFLLLLVWSPEYACWA